MHKCFYPSDPPIPSEKIIDISFTHNMPLSHSFIVCLANDPNGLQISIIKEDCLIILVVCRDDFADGKREHYRIHAQKAMCFIWRMYLDVGGGGGSLLE